MVKNLTANVGDFGSIPESASSPGGSHGNPLQYSSVFLSGESHGEWGLGGYSPWGCIEPDTTAVTHACMYAHMTIPPNSPF